MVAVILLMLPICACKDGGVEAPSSSLPDSPAPPGVQESTPDLSSETPAPADFTEPPAPPLDDDTESVAPMSLSGKVIILFDYVRQSGSASNQHAVWIEDMEGNVIRTLFASRWTANGGYKTRPDSIALWAGRADLANMTSAEVDAVSGATPKKDESLSYTWDLTDMNGNTVAPGDYTVFVEGTLRWKNFVLYTGVITLGVEPVTIQANADFTFEGDGRYAALTETSGELGMIGPVTAVFTPTVG